MTLSLAIGLGGLGATIIALAAQIGRLRAKVQVLQDLQVATAEAVTKLASLVLTLQEQPTWPTLDAQGRIVPAPKPKGAP